MPRRSRQRAPGILDVARRAEVSAATVSRAFTRPASVRAETRARVLRAAAELGYIRDRMASGLQRRVSGSVGLIVPTIDNAIFAELIDAFSSRLLEHDRTTLIASHGYVPEREIDIVRSLLERRIDAIALVGRDHPAPALAMLGVRELPVVALWCARGPRCGGRRVPAIGADNAAAARAATEHLLELGHRDVALLFPDGAHNDRVRDRLRAARRALAEGGVELPPERLVRCPYDALEAKRIALELFERDPPTACLCGNDVIAHGALHAPRRRHIAVPERLSIVGIGDFTGSAAIEPGLTTVRLPARRIGRLAADALVARLAGVTDETVEDVLIPVELVVRRSSGPPSGGVGRAGVRGRSRRRAR